MQAKAASLGTMEIRSTPNRVETHVEDGNTNNHLERTSPEDDAEARAAPMPKLRRGGRKGVRMLQGKEHLTGVLAQDRGSGSIVCCDIIRRLSCVRTAQQLTCLLSGPSTDEWSVFSISLMHCPYAGGHVNLWEKSSWKRR